MAIKGGYKLIDLKDSKLTVKGDGATVKGNGVTVKGVYNSIKNSYNKLLILTGINIDDVERNDIFIDFTFNDDNYVANISPTEKITITKADLVTVAIIS